MPTVIRNLGYTNGVQRLAWTGPDATITAYLWGGGGGLGGADSQIGGNGSGGGYSTTNFTITDGDVLDVAVGGQGGNGQSGRGSAAGGTAGASYSSGGLVFNTRTTPASPAVYPYTNSSYCSFLNTYGVWEQSPGYTYFNRSYTINFPSTGTYTFTFSVDNYGSVTLDGTTIIALSSSSSANYQRSYQAIATVTAGNHTLSINAVNTGGPGSVALLVTGGTVFSGGRGGYAGPSGSSGGGGGGGGATVILLNDSVVAVAGGGAGGGGGGNRGPGQSAPGTAGQATIGTYAGQNGRDHPGDGGGGGGGGGGWAGGQGGDIPGGDFGGYAGAYGLGTAVSENPTGTSPAKSNSPYYRAGEARGATQSSGATAGFAAIVIQTTGVNVHDNIQFVPVDQTYIKDSGVWKPVQTIWINSGGSWFPVIGGVPPAFTTVSGLIGVNSRPWS